MKLSDTKIDPVKQEQGDWVGEKYGTPIPEMGDLCLKVRGSSNKQWRKLMQTLVNAIPRNQRAGGVIDPGEMDRVMAIVLRDAGLDDWSGMLDEDDKPLPYSKDKAGAILSNPEYAAFRDAVSWACDIVAKQKDTNVETDAKN